MVDYFMVYNFRIWWVGAYRDCCYQNSCYQNNYCNAFNVRTAYEVLTIRGTGFTHFVDLQCNNLIYVTVFWKSTKHSAGLKRSQLHWLGCLFGFIWTLNLFLCRVTYIIHVEDEFFIINPLSNFIQVVADEAVEVICKLQSRILKMKFITILVESWNNNES